MISAKILNSAATLNDFKELGSIPFVPGSEVTLVIRLWDTQLNLRRVPPAAAIITGTFNNQDNTTLVKTFTPLIDDRSILSTTFSEAETTNLVGGSFTLSEDTLGDGSSILLGYINSKLMRSISGDC